MVRSKLMGLGRVKYFDLYWINQSELLFVVSSGELRRRGGRNQYREIIIYIIYFKHIVAL